MKNKNLTINQIEKIISIHLDKSSIKEIKGYAWDFSNISWEEFNDVIDDLFDDYFGNIKNHPLNISEDDEEDYLLHINNYKLFFNGDMQIIFLYYSGNPKE